MIFLQVVGISKDNIYTIYLQTRNINTIDLELEALSKAISVNVRQLYSTVVSSELVNASIVSVSNEFEYLMPFYVNIYAESNGKFLTLDELNE